MTGCPNGCARPYNADIGLVGRSAHVNPDGTPGPGNIHDLPGRTDHGRPAEYRIQGLCSLRRVVAELVPVFVRFKDERMDGESFGDYCDRVGVANLAMRGWPAEGAAV